MLKFLFISGSGREESVPNAGNSDRVMTRAQVARHREHTDQDAQGDAMSEDEPDAPDDAVDVGEVVAGEDTMDEDSEPIQEGSLDEEDDEELDSGSDEEISDDG